MLWRLIGEVRAGWWIAVTLAALLLVVACGGPENPEFNTQGQLSSGISSGQVASAQEQAQLGDTNGSTASNQTPQGAADSSGGQNSQVSETGGQSSAVVPRARRAASMMTWSRLWKKSWG